MNEQTAFLFYFLENFFFDLIFEVIINWRSNGYGVAAVAEIGGKSTDTMGKWGTVPPSERNGNGAQEWPPKKAQHRKQQTPTNAILSSFSNFWIFSFIFFWAPKPRELSIAPKNQ